MEEDLWNSEKRLAQAIEGNSIPTFIIDNNHSLSIRQQFPLKSAGSLNKITDKGEFRLQVHHVMLGGRLHVVSRKFAP